MKPITLVLMVSALLFLYGCEQPVVCNKPYLLVGTECCLDNDDNKICDADETFVEDTRIVVTEKEPVIVEKEINNYVCSDGSVVEDPAECPIETDSSDEPTQAELNIPLLDTSSEEKTVIETIEISSACIKGVNGGEVFFKVGTVPSDISYQIKEVGQAQDFEEIYTRKGVYQGFASFAVCDYCRQGDFRLQPDTAYIFRMTFNQTPVYDRIEQSNEYLIDTRSDTEIMGRICSR